MPIGLHLEKLFVFRFDGAVKVMIFLVPASRAIPLYSILWVGRQFIDSPIPALGIHHPPFKLGMFLVSIVRLPIILRHGTAVVLLVEKWQLN